MALEKAEVQPLDDRGNPSGGPIQVLFNPTEYSIEKSNQFQSTALPGLATPAMQFVSGNDRTLSMDLFFDTYETGEDVRVYSGKLVALLDIDPDLHAPPVCRFTWGELDFKAVLERVSQRFTMFLDSGVPVRATLSVSFKEYRTLTEQLQNPPRQSADRTKRRVVTRGDSLWLMADREYGDPGLWRPIAEANGIDNPRVVEVGRELVIPPLE